MPVTVSSRQHALNRQIQRLSRLFTRQESIIERLSWIRLILFLFFVVVVFVTARRFSTTVTVFTGLLCFCIFNLVAFFHRQRIRYKKRLKMWHRFKSSQAARMSCDWRNIPLRKIEDHLPTSHILADLDITGPQSLFHLIDMTITDKAGRRLVELLGRATPDLAVIKKNQRLVQELFLMPHFRNKLLRIFFLISSDLVHTDALLNWLKIKKPARLLTRMMPVAVFWVAINIALFIGFVLSIIPPYWILSLSFYTAFHLLSQRIINIFFEMIIQLDEELTKFRRALRVLENYPFLPGGALARLCRPFTSLRISPSRQLRRIKFLTAAVGLRMNPMMNMALNLVLPYDFICSYLAHRAREKMLNILPSWVDRFADFEVLLSLANFAYLNPEHVFPRIKQNDGDQAPVFQVRSLAHPLLPFQTRVSNDFCLKKPGETVIITGSNMSGKSTFLKTIGVNFCLAYAGAPVTAAEFIAVPCRLFTSMQINDSVTDGLSFFYLEVRRLKELFLMLEESDKPPVFFLIDEIFRGTNNRERQIGGRAVLEALLEKNCMGCVSTHDLDLIKLAGQFGSVTNSHFRDDIQGGRLKFDFKLRLGPCPTTNALKIMRWEGLPVSSDQ